MNLELRNLKLHPLTENQPKYYHAIGCIDLYDENEYIKATVRVDIPKCCYDSVIDELIVIADNEGVD